MLDYSAACSRLRVRKLQVEIRGEEPLFLRVEDTRQKAPDEPCRGVFAVTFPNFPDATGSRKV